MSMLFCLQEKPISVAFFTNTNYDVKQTVVLPFEMRGVAYRSVRFLEILEHPRATSRAHPSDSRVITERYISYTLKLFCESPLEETGFFIYVFQHVCQVSIIFSRVGEVVRHQSAVR